MKRFRLFYVMGAVVFIFSFILLSTSTALASWAGNYFVSIRSYNGETIVDSPQAADLHADNNELPTLEELQSAAVSVVYDGQDHGFRFSCVSSSIYSAHFVSMENMVQECTVVNEAGESVPFELIDSASSKAVYLVKPDAGIYTVNMQGSWESGSISGTAFLITTITVEKADLSGCVTVEPYTGIYDASYHDAMTVSVSEDIGPYSLEYKKDGGEYSATLPKIKTVAESGKYYCRITPENPNFKQTEIETNVSIQKRTVNLIARNAVKCAGEEDPEFAYDITGLATYDRLTGITMSRDEGEDAGEYLIIPVMDAQSNPNHIVNIQYGVLTIRPHEWGDPIYSWTENYHSCTAVKVCQLDESHILNVNASVAFEFQPPTEENEGVLKATATFEDEQYQSQEIIIAIPALSDMKILRLPAQIKEIETEAFSGLACEAIIIPDGCQTIGSKAFSNCSSLVYIQIPRSVVFIAPDAFEDCGPVAVDKK